jgi:hypothetical protein
MTTSLPVFVVDVGRHEPDRRQDLEFAVPGRVARQHLDVVAGCAEPRHDLLADVARAAEHADLQ